MNTQMVHIPFLGNGDGIIQILCILTINRNCLKISEIGSSSLLLLFHLIRNILDLLHHIIRILLRKTVCHDHGKNINTRIIDMSQNLQNTSLRLTLLIAKIRDLDNNLVTGHRPLALCFRNINILGKFLIIRRHKAKITAACIGSDKNTVAPFKNIKHLTLAPFAFAAFLFDKYLHGIAIQCALGIGTRNENIVILSFHAFKTKAALCRHILSDLDICRKRLDLPFQINADLAFPRQRV